MQHLENDYLRMDASPQGAELTRIFDKKNQLERLWSGDPNVWNRHAPILFPIVGRLLNNRYTVSGKEYSLPQHGFARDCAFQVKRETDSTLSYELMGAKGAREDYPFAFALQVDYTLVDNQVRVAYTVSNPGDEIMYFSIGGHPGFTCPLLEGEAFNDYYIQFEKKETCARWYANENGHIHKKEEDYLQDTDMIPYTRDRFKEDALIFKDLQSTRVSIKSFKNDHAVTMDFAGWPYLGIWSKPDGAPFICLEPWYGIADHVEHRGELSEKEGILSLEPGLNFCCEYGLAFA